MTVSMNTQGFLFLLTIIFTLLKLSGVVNHSWLLILIPLWALVAVIVVKAIRMTVRGAK